MQRIINFIKGLTLEGVQIILITDLPGQFEKIDKVFVVGDWNESWEVVDKKVGSNRKILTLETLNDDISELEALETYVQAGILEDKMFLIKQTTDNIMPKKKVQDFISKLRHLVIILGGNNFYRSVESMKNKLSDYDHRDFIVGPLSEKKDSDGLFYYRPKALTLIIEWPRMLDRKYLSNTN